MTTVALPRMGGYSDLLTLALNKYFGWQVVTPSKITQVSMEEGAKYMNELMCLPAKVTLGGFIEACRSGITNCLMFDSCGQCRLKCYWILQEQVLRRLGYQAKVFPVRLGLFTPNDICRIDPSVSLWRAWQAFIHILKIIHAYDMGQVKPPDRSKPQIGLVGEIYTLLESAVNRRLIEKLEKLGAQVYQPLTLSYFVFKKLRWKNSSVNNDVHHQAAMLARRYFPQKIGGHGNDAILHTLYYALNKFDGVIHVLPFPCAPEATVASVLEYIGHDYGLPVMRLIFDLQSGEGGLDTRLEAFVDMIKGKREKKYERICF